jgi:hypothetical protein
LTKAVGQGAERYYQRSIDEAGEPPGIWLGAAAGELGLTGEVDVAVMTDLYTDFIDPRKRDAMHAQLDAITAEKGSDEYKAQEKAIRAEARLGTAPKSYEKAYEKRLAAALEKEGSGATPERIKQIEMQVRKDAPSATLYYDLTFSEVVERLPRFVAGAGRAVPRGRRPRRRGEVHQAAQQVWGAWMTVVRSRPYAGRGPIGHSQESLPDTTWRGEAVVSQSSENQNFPHPVNDFGGLPAGPMVFAEHELSPWEKRCHATLECLYWREVMSQEEKRRTIEDLGQTLYAGLGYYQKWALSVATCLTNKGLLTQDELAAKTDEVRARLEAEARS